MIRPFLLAAAFFASIATQADAAITWVRGSSSGDANCTNTNITSQTTTLSAAVTSGDTLVIGIETNTGGGTIQSVKDDQSNAYALLASATSGSIVSIYELTNITNAPTSVIVTMTAGTNFLKTFVDEFSGVATSSETDGSASVVARGSTGTGVNAVTSNNITTLVNNDLIYGLAVSLAGNTTYTAGTNIAFTLRTSDSGPNCAMASESAILATAGTTTADFTQNATDSPFVGVMALKPAAGGPACPKTLASMGVGC